MVDYSTVQYFATLTIHFIKYTSISINHKIKIASIYDDGLQAVFTKGLNSIFDKLISIHNGGCQCTILINN